MKKASDRLVSRSLKQALKAGLISLDDSAVIFIDLSILEERLTRLTNAFPSHSVHAIAIKTNPLSAILKYLVSLGYGLEAASMGEVFMAVNAGASPDQIVFDSPAKTVEEIAKLGHEVGKIRINADSFDELCLYDDSESGFHLGIRVNPLMDVGSVGSMNVSTGDSKFGVSIVQREQIINAFLKWADLDCLHVHVGSQFSNIDATVNALRKVVDLANYINESLGQNKVCVIDIGGGFPVNYGSGQSYLIEEYASKIEKICPELFDGTYQLITEFGRYLHANACWALSKIEYVKVHENKQTLITHLGADMFLRECYNPSDWQVNLLCLDSDGSVKNKRNSITDVAGPLCFGGDFISKGIEFPSVSDGDYIAFKDIGANTFALWSRHCSRPFPKVIAFHGEAHLDDMKIIKEREAYEEIIAFWS